jgi:hypothetical protein
LELNNLPSSIKKLTFYEYSNYNLELSNLPKFIEIIQLGRYYNKKILSELKYLKKLICSNEYAYKNDFDNLIVQTY